MRRETIICDGCNEEINDNYTDNPFEIKTWKCTPNYRKIRRPSHGGIREPISGIDFCPECFDEIRRILIKK